MPSYYGITKEVKKDGIVLDGGATPAYILGSGIGAAKITRIS